jgi:hypothetical protein
MSFRLYQLCHPSRTLLRKSISRCNSDLMIEPRDLSGRTMLTAPSTPGRVTKTSVSASISMLYSRIQLNEFFSRMHKKRIHLDLETGTMSLDWSTTSRLILKMRSFKFA